MNNILYAIGDLFETTFGILEKAGNFPNVIIVIVGARMRVRRKGYRKSGFP